MQNIFAVRDTHTGIPVQCSQGLSITPSKFYKKFREKKFSPVILLHETSFPDYLFEVTKILHTG